MPSVLDRERTVAPPGYNRWLVPPAALAVHLSIGEVYAFSVFKAPLVTHFDSSLTAIGVVFSIAIVMLGLSAAFGGTWVERNGPRKAMTVSMLCWVTGFLVSALGVATGQLWLVYLGYGVIGGIGLGIGYISPVSTLIKWFPDRPGLATGLAIMGFGGGALVASPLTSRLLDAYAGKPEDAIAPTMLTLAAVYLVLMALGAWVIRVPAEGWTPPGYSTGAAVVAAARRPGLGHGAPADLTANQAIRTPQFWLLWTVLFCNVTAGIGILEQAAPMIQDFFSDVDATEAAGFVGLLSLCNMAGRFVWSSTSDVIGRKPIYAIYLGAGALLYLVLALRGTAGIGLFVAVACLILSFYGGGFATIPAYLKDLFGGLQVGAVHGRLLTAWSAAGVVGPMVVNRVADHQTAAGKSGADLYSLSFAIMVGILVVGFVANALVRSLAGRAQAPSGTSAPESARTSTS
ncbi:OFA family MFS transporter [Kineosporia sp. J2-2]|uniref:OFA family MFS transporter n=1 Tax=Kineosporia corallincola TaxID=2835133 RepID=A0ABS5TKM3_9ACTN|nr:OFA family MFS transporter [Kineosporia corallincola]MBT0771646.1 OFA family MFS transporter [Kineosporia corallincola]